MKLIDFGLARILENADPKSNELYTMSGETGSLRYMAPEVAEGLPYNHKADVYSFGIILWELNAGKKPFVGLNRESFYERIVHGGERPSLNKKWPPELCQLIKDCWGADIDSRPTFGEVIERIDALLSKEKAGGKGKGRLGRISGLIDRHSTWF
jgi:serine/threonine protein kinase